MFAHGPRSVVAGEATGGDSDVVHRDDAEGERGGVAIAALVGGRQVRGWPGFREAPVVTGTACRAGARVVEARLAPCDHGMAVTTTCRTRDVSGRLAGLRERARTSVTSGAVLGKRFEPASGVTGLARRRRVAPDQGKSRGEVIEAIVRLVVSGFGSRRFGLGMRVGESRGHRDAKAQRQGERDRAASPSRGAPVPASVQPLFPPCARDLRVFVFSANRPGAT